MSDEDSTRPFGFMLFRYYETEHGVPEIVVNPEDIAECYTNTRRYETRPDVVVRLKDGQKLRVWSYSTDLKKFLADMDTAMRERLQLAPKTVGAKD